VPAVKKKSSRKAGTPPHSRPARLSYLDVESIEDEVGSEYEQEDPLWKFEGDKIARMTVFFALMDPYDPATEAQASRVFSLICEGHRWKDALKSAGIPRTALMRASAAAVIQDAHSGLGPAQRSTSTPKRRSKKPPKPAPPKPARRRSR
jgi:hypothetical protein